MRRDHFVFFLVLLLFTASGAAALIYEVTWYQLLQLVVGSTAISLGLLLAAFMGGLCLGSYFLPRRVPKSVHPLRLFAAIELGIAIFGLLVLWLLPALSTMYAAAVRVGLSSMLLRGLLAAICLLPPTVLMGASLPVISRMAGFSRRAETLWGWLYTGNTLGAAGGAVLASFVLLRLFDVGVATYAAAAINVGVAAIALLLALWLKQPAEAVRPAVPANDQAALWPVALAIGLSGATALGAEVVFTRLLGMLFGSTVYAFATILTVFLLGIALGSGLASLLMRLLRPRAALGLCQLLLAASIVYAAHVIAVILPGLVPATSLDGWEVAHVDLMRSIFALAPATLLWGASFPLAMAAARGAGADGAGPVGVVYGANTLGGIIGALATSLVLITTIGSRDTERLMVVLAAASGAAVLLPGLLRRPLWAAGAGALAVAAAALAVYVPPQSAAAVALGPNAPNFKGWHPLEIVEGRNSTVAITTRYDGIVQISVSGHVEATDQIDDMRLQRMVGHLPALFHPGPVKILGIGFGAGVSAGSFTNYPSVKSITVCELEPMVPPTSSKWFAKADNNIYHDPRFHVVYDDGRHYIMTTRETYDIIASDPLDVWAKGTATIYSEDYFRAVKAHLNPGGLFTLYVPLYQTSEVTLKSELATFFKVFPNATVWANTEMGGVGYDMVVMGQADPLKLDIGAVEARLARPDYAKVRQSLSEIGFGSATDLYSTFAAQESDLHAWMADAQINTDRNLRLMYLAGWTYNSAVADPLYRTLLSMRHPPSNIFQGDPMALSLLYGRMETRARTYGAGQGEE